MGQIDYDMSVFKDRISDIRSSITDSLGEKPFLPEESYFIEDKGNEEYCMEYGFSTAQELYELFDRFLDLKTDDAAKRSALIRACIAACYKYSDGKMRADNAGMISEFIYEF